MDLCWPILMKFNVVWLISIILHILLFIGHGGVNCIVNHDLLLTPQQGYHWQRSKRIFYKDSLERDQGLMQQQQHIDDTLRPWEHTLKHVTFLTIFANSSKDLGLRLEKKSYENFQLSPYISAQGSRPDIRFGDIVTLAQGRLVHLFGNQSHQYQFVEDTCNGVIIFKCSLEILHPATNTASSRSKSDTIAVWLVQRIRHRDTNHRYIYDIRFSIKPIRLLSQINIMPERFKSSHNKLQHLKYNQLNGYRKDETIRNNFEQSEAEEGEEEELRFRSYIQRLNDYPNSLRRLHHYAHPTGAADEETYDFGKRRQPIYYPATVLPSSLTINSPPPSAAYNKGNPLNIGEYYRIGKTPVSHTHPLHNDQQQHQQHQRKNNILPNLLSLVFGKGPSASSSSAMISNQSTSRSKPFKTTHTTFDKTHFDENFGSESNVQKFNEINGQQPSMIKAPSPSLVTHHFHHYYYLPPPSASLNINDPGNLEGKPMDAQLINIEQLNSNHHHQHPLANGYSLMNNMKGGDTFLVMPPPTASMVPPPYFQRPPIASSPPMHQQIHPVHEQSEHDQQMSEKAPPILNYVSNQVPLFIYPESVEEPILMHHHQLLPPSTSVLPPFKKSELDTGAIRYSDPDPIYHGSGSGSGSGNVKVYYPNYNRTNTINSNAKSFIKSYDNEFRKLKLQRGKGGSDWQGREKLSYGSIRNPGDDNKQHLFTTKPNSREDGFDRNNKSRKNLISKSRLTDIFKANNNDSMESSEFEPETHNDIIETTVTQSSSYSTIKPRSSSVIVASTQTIANTDHKPLEKYPKTQQTPPTNNEKRSELSLKSRARNKANSIVNDTITTTTNPNSLTMETTTANTNNTTTTSSTLLGNTLISPRVIRRLKTMRVASGDEMDYEGSNSVDDRKKISVTPSPTTLITSTIKPLEKAVLRWKLKRKVSDRESFPRRSLNMNQTIKINTNMKTTPKTMSDGDEFTSNATVKSSPSTRNRKYSTLKLNGNESLSKRRNKTMTVEKNHDNYPQTFNINDGLSISTPTIDGSNSSIEQFPGMPGIRTSDRVPKDSMNHVTVTTTSIPDDGKTYEVLTQKSISKSISFKVGGNGEQIVLIHDDTTP